MIGRGAEVGGKSIQSIHFARVQKCGSLDLTNLHYAVATGRHYLGHQALAMSADDVIYCGHTVRMGCRCHRRPGVQRRKWTSSEGPDVLCYDLTDLFVRSGND